MAVSTSALMPPVLSMAVLQRCSLHSTRIPANICGLWLIERLPIASSILETDLTVLFCRHKGVVSKGGIITCCLLWLHWLFCALHGQHGQSCSQNVAAAAACAPPASLMISSLSHA